MGNEQGEKCVGQVINLNQLLGILCSKTVRFISKSYLSHGVDLTDSLIEEIPISSKYLKPIQNLVNQTITKLMNNPHYDYASSEQIKIDQFIYEMYGLNNEDIKEVETWYRRRYPRLAKAQEKNQENGK